MSTTAIPHASETHPRSTAQSVVRELDFRSSDGIDVRLLWNSRTDDVSITVDDRRLGESMAFEVDAPDALCAFHHPYAYAATPRADERVATSPNPRRPR
jgi:hypothetical protein